MERDRYFTPFSWMAMIFDKKRRLFLFAFLGVSWIASATGVADDRFITQPKRPSEQQHHSTVGPPPPVERRDAVPSQDHSQPNGVVESSQGSTIVAEFKPILVRPSRAQHTPVPQSQRPLSFETAPSQPSSPSPREPDRLTWVRREHEDTTNPKLTSPNALAFQKPPTNARIIEISQAAPSVVDRPLSIAQPAELQRPQLSPQLSRGGYAGEANHGFIVEPSYAAPMGYSRETALDPPNGTEPIRVQANLASTSISTADSESRVTKTQLASRISRQILGDSDEQDLRTVRPGSNVAGWDAIGRHLSSHLQRSDELARRGAFLSARDEAHQALVQLARHLDHLTNRFLSEPSLHAAKTALRESGDFANSPHITDAVTLKEIVHSHETSILKQGDLSRVSPLTIAEHYRSFAEQQLLVAAQSHPWFSDILYKLGRTYQAEADQSSGMASEHLRYQAVVYYRAALGILPDNSLAANQLGYILLQQDRPQEAQQVLLASVHARPEAPALQNLAEASRRLGDQTTHQWAMQSLAAARHHSPPAQSATVVQVVDQATFASLHSMGTGPQPSAQPAAARNAQVPTTLR